MKVKGCSRKSKNIANSFVYCRIDFCCYKFYRRTLLIVKLQKAAKALYIFLVASVSTMYTLIMFLITVDRFLVTYLNIKYDIPWSLKKTIIVLSVLLITSSLSFAPSYVIGQKKVETIETLYIIPILDAIFMISASVIFSYIFKQILRKRRNMKRLQQQLKVSKLFIMKNVTTDSKYFYQQ